MAKSTKMTFCSFCGKSQNEVRKMIAGPAGVYICDSCVTVCKTIIDRELRSPQEETEATFKLVKPGEIKGVVRKIWYLQYCGEVRKDIKLTTLNNCGVDNIHTSPFV